MASCSPPATDWKVRKRMCLSGTIDDIASPSDDVVKLCFMVPKGKRAGQFPRLTPRIERGEVMQLQQLGEVKCVRGSILGEPACSMTCMRGRRLGLHIQVAPKDEDFTIRDPVNAAVEFLPKGSTLVEDCFAGNLTRRSLAGRSHSYFTSSATVMLLRIRTMTPACFCLESPEPMQIQCGIRYSESCIHLVSCSSTRLYMEVSKKWSSSSCRPPPKPPTFKQKT